jgi:hypothetical protein
LLGEHVQDITELAGREEQEASVNLESNQRLLALKATSNYHCRCVRAPGQGGRGTRARGMVLASLFSNTWRAHVIDTPMPICLISCPFAKHTVGQSFSQRMGK